MKKKILFIINPKSGQQKGINIVKFIDKFIDNNKFEYSYQLTRYPKHAVDIAAKAVQDEMDIVVAVGGDGLVNEVFQSLVNTDTAFSILPVGSGNGVARSVGISMNIKKALSNIAEGKLTKIDTVMFNNQPYLGVAGIGFDGLIAWEFSKAKKRGMLSYVKIILKRLIAFRSSQYVIASDSVRFSFDAFMVTVANTQQYGNNAFIAPKSELANGQLDLVVIKKHSKWLLPILAVQVMTKSIHKSKYVKTIRGSKFHIWTSYSQAHIDGEPILAKKKNDITILPLSLNIYS